MSDTLKHKTIKGIAWSSVDRIVTTLINFILGILIARILSPDDYGIIGILMVFVVFSNIFVDGGMSIALIQKTNCTDKDYNTAYLYNIAVSLIIYILLFIISPFIAQFYGNHIISPLLRVLSFSIVVSSLSSIQNTILQKTLDFKSLSISSILSCLISGIIGWIAAMKGFSIWALVIQQLVLCIIKTTVIILVSSWRPTYNFSFISFRELFSFGSRLIATNVLGRMYDNLYPLIIGKLYPMAALGNYTRGQHFAQLPVSVLLDVFQRVTFPIMSSIKKDKIRLAKIYRLYIELSSAIVFPIMFILIIVAKPLIVILLTEKWIDACPFLQILCFGFMFNHISAINLNLLYVEGRSDLALKLEIIKKTTATLILLISIIGGLWWICIGQSLYSIIAIYLNSLYTKRIIGISTLQQIKDFGKVWVYAFLPFLVSYYLTSTMGHYVLHMIVGGISYCFLYFFVNIFLKSSFYYYSKEILTNVFTRKLSNIIVRRK